MYRRIHDRFGVVGAVLGMVALVLALGGTAIAAKNALTGPEKKLIEKEAKKFAKKFAMAGPQGAPGAAGAQGSPGSKGDKGDNGQNGSAGQSVTASVEPPFGECGEEEGLKLTSGSGVNYVCNGAQGQKGDTGSPWPVDNALPSGATETGAWSLPRVGADDIPIGVETLNIAIPFTIPLAAELDAEHVHVIDEAGKEVFYDSVAGEPKEVTSTACLGSPKEPKATPGNLCIYVAFLSPEASPGGAFGAFKYIGPVKKAAEPFEGGASTAGALLRLHVIEGSQGSGTWAVTAAAPTP